MGHKSQSYTKHYPGTAFTIRGVSIHFAGSQATCAKATLWWNTGSFEKASSEFQKNVLAWLFSLIFKSDLNLDFLV